MQKTFLLCVGAQKSGTSWLHNYFRDHPNTDMGFMKEYHIFDALFVPEGGIRKRYLQGRINEVFKVSATPTIKDVLLLNLKIARSIFSPPQKDILLLKFLGDVENYFDYFYSIANKRSDILLTGDITPSYSALPVDALNLIATGSIPRPLGRMLAASKRIEERS